MCKVVIETPVNLSRAQRKQVEALQTSLDSSDYQPKARRWYEGVKAFLNLVAKH